MEIMGKISASQNEDLSVVTEELSKATESSESLILTLLSIRDAAERYEGEIAVLKKGKVAVMITSSSFAVAGITLMSIPNIPDEFKSLGAGLTAAGITVLSMSLIY